MLTVDPPVEKVYSSPYYRCLQTVEPFISQSSRQTASESHHQLAIHGETGLAEWYGAAPFEHPTSEPLEKLKQLFPALDTDYVPTVVPNRSGESIAQLHDRVASALDSIIKQCDRSGVRAILLCSHAAVIIAMGRVLTGCMPEDIATEDFRCFTCGLSRYRRRETSVGSSKLTAGASRGTLGDRAARHQDPSKVQAADPVVDWRDGKGVRGGWFCEVNSDCGFLKGGEERGW